MVTLYRAALAAVAAMLLLASPASARLGVTVSNQVGVLFLDAPTQASFGGWPIGQTSDKVVVTFTNNNTDSFVTASAGSIDGRTPADFKLADDGCAGQRLPPNGGSCDDALTFTPGAQGTRTAILHVPDSQGTDNQVDLDGVGTVHLAHDPQKMD